ncbi:MAG: hypothetical protein ABEJ91_01700 [Candidatus Nanohaloarchaea archaeon]
MKPDNTDTGDLELMERIASESRLTAEDVEELSRKIGESVAENRD